MGTDIHPEVSKHSKYWLSKHRYYELKHFCLQYEEWKEELKELDGYPTQTLKELRRKFGKVTQLLSSVRGEFTTANVSTWSKPWLWKPETTSVTICLSP